jgi:signal transduction histidine kinase
MEAHMDAERRVHDLETIAQVSAVITGILNESDLLAAVANITCESFPEFRMCIYLLRNSVLELIEVQRTIEPLIDPRLHRISLNEQRSLMTEVVATRESRLIADIARHSHYDLLPFMPNARSEMVIPMIASEEVLGAVSVQSQQKGRFTEDDTRIFKTLVDLIAVALQNARHYGQARQIAVLEERNRMARELHDSVSQALYGIVLGAQTAESLLHNKRLDQLPDAIDYVLSLAKAGLDEIRASIFDLRPLQLQEHGLVYAVNSQAQLLQSRHAMAITCHLCHEPNASFLVKEAVYRILREAMHNIVKHAHATHVELSLSCLNNVIAFEIEDNGTGFDAEAEPNSGFGLRSMHERAMALGGTLIIDSAIGRGTRIAGFIPCENNNWIGPFNTAA